MLFLQIVLDRLLRLPQSIQGAVEPILGDLAVGNPQEVFQPRRGVPVLGQSELARRGAEPVDDLDRHHVRRTHRVPPRRKMTRHDLVQLQQPPQPQAQPHVAERPGIGPPRRGQPHADDVRFVGQGQARIVGKQPQLLGIPVAVVEDDRPLPPPLLAVVEFPQMRHDPLPRPFLSPQALHQGPVAVDLARLLPCVLPQKHRLPPDIQDAKESGGSKREGFHYIARRRFPLPRNQDLRQETGREPGKIARIFCEVRNLG